LLGTFAGLNRVSKNDVSRFAGLQFFVKKKDKNSSLINSQINFTDSQTQGIGPQEIQLNNITVGHSKRVGLITRLLDLKKKKTAKRLMTYVLEDIVKKNAFDTSRADKSLYLFGEQEMTAGDFFQKCHLNLYKVLQDTRGDYLSES